MILFRALSILALMNLTTAAFAGWVSGGGNLLFDDGNPWFVQNTESVDYCIEIDEENFGTSRVKIQQHVQAAIGYWFKELLRAEAWPISNLTRTRKYEVEIGTQRFNEVFCGTNEMLRFQFGVLNSEQKVYLRDPSKIVGTTVRTHYDPQNLRGAGFIYISPEQGSLGMKHPRLVEKVWSIDGGMRLELVLMHELGHVFGIEHTNSGLGLMDHDFPEAAVTMKKLPPSNMNPRVFAHHSNFTALRAGFSHVGSPFSASEVLGLPQGWDLVQAQFSLEEKMPRILFWAGQGGEISSMRLLGQARFHFTNYDHVPMVSIYLRENQQVFPRDAMTDARMTIAVSNNFTYTGEYEVDGQKRQMTLSISPQKMTIGGTNAAGTLLPLAFHATAWWDYVGL